jgi:hypothetical protein
LLVPNVGLKPGVSLIGSSGDIQYL